MPIRILFLSLKELAFLYQDTLNQGRFQCGFWRSISQAVP